MNLDEQMSKIVAERNAIQERQQAAHQRLAEATKQHAAAIAERDRLQNACITKKAKARPYTELGQATVAVDDAAAQLKAAESEVQDADNDARTRLSDLNRQEAEARRKAAVADFRAAVLNYERAIQIARLAPLSDEIRRLAGLAGVRLEEFSPLIDDEYAVIGNYPLNIRAVSSPEGRSPLAMADDE